MMKRKHIALLPITQAFKSNGTAKVLNMISAFLKSRFKSLYFFEAIKNLKINKTTETKKLGSSR